MLSAISIACSSVIELLFNSALLNAIARVSSSRLFANARWYISLLSSDLLISASISGLIIADISFCESSNLLNTFVILLLIEFKSEAGFSCSWPKA